eukprot:scaffold27074_cov34-Phaeocystis_antarctica.AAC.1
MNDGYRRPGFTADSWLWTDLVLDQCLASVRSCLARVIYFTSSWFAATFALPFYKCIGDTCSAAEAVYLEPRDQPAPDPARCFDCPVDPAPAAQ